MKNILILMGRYLPGYKDGGPVRTIVNLVDILGDEYNFNIMTSDRDHGNQNTYDNINVDNWNRVGKANVYYVKDEKFKFKIIKKIAKNNDLVYCCGPYNLYAIKVMVLRKFNIVKQPLVIASMGSFSTGALAIKSTKKYLFLKVFKVFGLFEKVIWSVTSEVEKRELEKLIGENASCIIAEDLPRNTIVKHTSIKKKNELKIIFLSRICEMKNLLGVINILSQINSVAITFDIYGNVEDVSYWDKCNNELEKLPSNIEWNYCGECESEKVPETFAQYDIFLFPTLGENYGHVIGESLLAGCIPIISNNTPWLDFDRFKCGNVIDLDKKENFINKVNEYAVMNNDDFCEYTNSAQEYILKKNKKCIEETGYHRIFCCEAKNND